MPNRRGPNPTENASTRTPQSFATRKWPNSCTTTITPTRTIKATAETKKSCINEMIQTFHGHVATQRIGRLRKPAHELLDALPGPMQAPPRWLRDATPAWTQVPLQLYPECH